MIVVCNACHARFRVADEKVGPRGVRIRCSKCQNVFAVQPPKAAEEPERPAPAPPPPVELDLDDAGRSRDQAPAPSTPAPPDPFAAASDLFLAAAADPFASAAASPQVNDPFAQPTASALALATDPFAAAGLSTANATPPSALDDPFAAPALPRDGAGGEAPPPPPPDLLAAPPAPARRAVPPPLPKGGAGSTTLAADDSGALSLEEKTDSGELAGPGHFEFDPAGGLDLGAEVGEASHEKPAADDLSPARTPAMAERPSVPEASPPPPAAVEVHRPAVGDGRFRAALVNSLSLAVLLSLALGLFMFWRDPKILQRGHLAAKAGSGAAAVATQVSSGLYRAFDGRLLLFVRGRIRVEAPSALGAVKVRADLVMGEAVVATAESTAGAVPTPEELASVSGREDAERLRALLARRAPREARPGELLPFLVVFTDYPGDLGQVTIHVAAEAAAAGSG